MPLHLWDDLEDEFTLFGVRSRGMSETRFIFNINKQFNFKFYRIEDLDVCIQGQEYCFSLYCHDNLVEDNQFYIIKNQSHNKQMDNVEGSLFASYNSSEVILSKYKVFDYLIKLPYNENEIVTNPLPLNEASFIQKISLINSLSTKEKKLLFI